MNPYLKIMITCTVIAIFGFGCTGKERNTPLGLNDGRLAECPSSPNCVSTRAGDAAKRMRTLPFVSDATFSRQKIVAIVKSLKRSVVITEQDHYLHIEFRSAVFRFVDDVEFFFDESAKLIHFRSASRTGYSDFGVNRKRMESIAQSYTRDFK
jgi:uncharacterized protein (DUF1499 family)